MALHTPLKAVEIESLAGQFGVVVRDFRHLQGGVENTSYAVSSADGDFVLTVLEKRGLAAGELYAGYIRALAENRLPVPRLLACSDGRLAAEFAGKPVLMLEFVHGVQHDPLPERHLPEVGAALARLHTSAVECPLDPHIRLGEAELRSAASFADREFGEWLVRRHEEVAGALDAGYPRVATHGDPFPDNLIVATDGRVVLVDWEDGARDSPLVDLGMSVLGLCGGERFDAGRLNRLLVGYRSVSEIPIGREDLLRATIYVALFTAYNRYLKERAGLGSVAPGRSYRVVPPLIDSVVAAWDRVEL